jgi:hypothetical protein
VDTAIDHDHIQLAVVLQNRDVLKRVAIDEYAVSIVARLDPTQFMLSHEEFGNTVRGSDDALMRRKAKEFGEMLEISGVGTVGRPSEPIVTIAKKERVSASWARRCGGMSSSLFFAYVPAWQYHDSTTMHFAKTEDGNVEFLLVPILFSFLLAVAERTCIVDRAHKPVYSRCNDMLGLALLEHIHT